MGGEGEWVGGKEGEGSIRKGGKYQEGKENMRRGGKYQERRGVYKLGEVC